MRFLINFVERLRLTCMAVRNPGDHTIIPVSPSYTLAARMGLAERFKRQATDLALYFLWLPFANRIAAENLLRLIAISGMR